MKKNESVRMVKVGLVLLALGILSRCDLLAGGTVTVCDEANLRAALAGGGAVTFASSGTITLANTLIITNATTIDASGYSVTLSGSNAVRVLEVNNGSTLSLMNLTIANGLAVGTNGAPNLPGGPAYGGGVWVDGGGLISVNCTFASNRAMGGTGGNYSGISGGMGGTAWGGAVYLKNGSLAATNCLFSDNSVDGGVGGDGVFSFTGNGGFGFGGAVCSVTGVVTLVNCEVRTNQARGGFAGVADSQSSTAGGASGGAIYESGGSLAVIGGEFLQNTAYTPNPAAFRNSGSGSAVSGGAIFKGDGFLSIAGSQFVSNSVAGGDAKRHLGSPGVGQGGAIWSSGLMTVSASSFLGNSVIGGNNGPSGADGFGGALFCNGESGITNSSFVANTALGGMGAHGGLGSVGNSSGRGGAIANSNSLVVVGSTFVTNSSSGRQGGLRGLNTPYPGSPGFGGAIYNRASCAITNSTLSENTALGGSFPFLGGTPSPLKTGGDASGGAVCNSEGSVLLAYSTVAGNSAVGGTGVPAGQSLGGGIQNSNGTVTLIGTIIDNSTSGGNASGPLADGNYNVSSDATCAFSAPASLNGTDPVLGPLANYGGPTLTMALLAGSPAIDGGDSITFPPTDQRGHVRAFGAAADIGAFESSPPYTVVGHISGNTLNEEVLVVAGLNSVSTVNKSYHLGGLAAGGYSVSPQSPNYLFVPSSQPVTVGPDQIGINFKAYRWNAISFEGAITNAMHLMIAGTNGQTSRLETSTDLTQWSSVLTNTIGSGNLWELFLPIGSDAARFYRTATP